MKTRLLTLQDYIVGWCYHPAYWFEFWFPQSGILAVFTVGLLLAAISLITYSLTGAPLVTAIFVAITSLALGFTILYATYLRISSKRYCGKHFLGIVTSNRGNIFILLDGVIEDEPVLFDDVPVFSDYLYVVDGRVYKSTWRGITVSELKAKEGFKEVRRCNTMGRMVVVQGRK